MRVIEVAAGLIHSDGRYLIARRKPGVHLAGLWEFPGGKREQGESFEECLCREIFEELTVRVRDLRLFQIVRHDYGDKAVELHFYRCTVAEGEARPVESAEIRWVYPHEMSGFAFPPADHVIIEALVQEARPYESRP